MGTAPSSYWDLEAWKTNLDLKNVFLANAFYRSRKYGFSDDELAMLYSCMDCYIHPSTMEGFGITVLEAMASAVPIVCTDLPIFRELYGEIPYYARTSKVIPTIWGNLEYLVDVDDMVDKILHVLDPKNYEQVNDRIKKGLEKISEYSWESAGVKLQSIIRQ
jgi:glycosyltransferase involved in cell wall biosynthesis